MPATSAMRAKPHASSQHAKLRHRLKASVRLAMPTPAISDPALPLANIHVQKYSPRAYTVRMVTIEVRLVQDDESGEWTAQATTTGAALPRTFTYSRRRTREEAPQDQELVAAWLRSELPRLSVAEDRARVVFVH